MLRLPGEQEQRRYRKHLKEVDILQHDREIREMLRRVAALE
jgi:hypothetical protein